MKYKIPDPAKTISQPALSVVSWRHPFWLTDWLAGWLKVCGNQKMSAKLFATTAKLFLYKCHNFLFVVHTEFASILASWLFVNVIQIDGQQSGRPAAVPRPPSPFWEKGVLDGGLSMSVCAKQLQFLTDCTRNV